MTQFAVILSGKGNTVSEVEYAIEACRQQVIDFCSIWGIDEVPAIAMYTDLSQLPQEDVWTVDIVDQLDEPGAAAYHSFDGKPYVKAASGPDIACKLSHEFCETLGDKTCDRWVPKGDGTEVAAEVSDPCQADTYPVLADVGGVGQTVEVSDFVLPPYFDRTQDGPTTKTEALGLRETRVPPFGIAPNGYQVVLGRDGIEHEVFARRVHIRASGDGIYAAAEKRKNPDSRLNRRLEGKRA